MDNLKDLKDELLVVTNRAEGNTPHVVKSVEPDGSLTTQPLAKAKPNDDFLKIDRSESILGTFFSNLWKQYERPSDFRFYHIPAALLASGKELVEIFKSPDKNKEMLADYLLDTPQPQQAQAERQQPATRWNIEEVDWQQLARMGITTESLGEIGTQRLLNGYESAVLNIKTSFEGISFETPACIRLVETTNGKPVLGVECCRQYPDLDTPYMGTELSPEMKENLSKRNHAGCVVELELSEGIREACLLSLNPKTNQLHHIPVSEVSIPKMVNNIELSDDQTTRLSKGESVLVEGMWSERKQCHYDARLQYNVCKGGFDYDFKGLNHKSQKQSQGTAERRELVIPTILKGVELTPEVRKKLANHETVYLKGMKNDKGETFNAYVRPNMEKRKFDFFRWNPDKKQRKEQTQNQSQAPEQFRQEATPASRNKRAQRNEIRGMGI